MESSTALKIVSALADGIDPWTGEAPLTEHVCQQPAVICALKLAVVALEQFSRRQKRQKAKPANAGVAWTEEEEKQLLLQI